jgi:Na+/H+-dicarboxylate symporter
MSKVTNDTDSLFKTYGSIIWLLCGITAGSILGLVLGRCGGYKTVGRYFKFTFLAIIPLIFFTIASSIASLEKSEKLGNYLSWSLVCFLVP